MRLERVSLFLAFAFVEATAVAYDWCVVPYVLGEPLVDPAAYTAAE